MKKFALFVTAALLLAACSSRPNPTLETLQTSYYVSPNGDDSSDGSLSSPWRTISFAVSAASPVSPGDTVIVQPGIYTEIVTIEKSGAPGAPITLQGSSGTILNDPFPNDGVFPSPDTEEEEEDQEDPRTVSFDRFRNNGCFGEYGPEGVIQGVRLAHWVIEGLRIEGASCAGIALQEVADIVIQNNETFDTQISGIIVLPAQPSPEGEAEVSSRDVRVLNNLVDTSNQAGTKSQEAVSIWGVDGFEVAFNTVRNGKTEGIDAKVGSRNGSIHGNVVSEQAQESGEPFVKAREDARDPNNGRNGGPAIYVDANRADSFNIDIYNNVVFNNKAEAITVSAEEPNQGSARNVRIYNNLTYGNGNRGVNSGAGVYVNSAVSGVEVYHNTLVNNVTCLFVGGRAFGGTVGPSNVTFRNNICAGSVFQDFIVEEEKAEDVSDILIDTTLLVSTTSANPSSIIAGDVQVTNTAQVDDAGFVNPSGNDYTLTSTSPAVDAGASDVGPATQDFEGDARPQGSAPDIGYDEVAGGTF